MTHWHGIITSRGGFPWATIEDAVARALRERGCRTWIPREHRPTGKRPDLTVPVVRGLVFVEAPIMWSEMHKIRGYRHPLRNGNGDVATISQEQIDRMRAACAPLLQRQTAAGLKRGDKVRIRFNAIADIEATITEIRKGRATVAYEMMGKTFEASKLVQELETGG